MTKKKLRQFRKDLCELLKSYDIAITPTSMTEIEVVIGFAYPIIVAIDWRETQRTGALKRVRI